MVSVAEQIRKTILLEITDTIIETFKNTRKELVVEIKKSEESIKGFTSHIGNFASKIFALKSAGKMFKQAGKAFKNKKAMTGFGKAMGAIATIGYGPFGLILSVLDALEIAEPILSAFTAILQIIGGTLMQTFGPALQEFIQTLFSPEIMEIMKTIGNLLGTLLLPIMKAFSIVLKALNPLFKILAKLLGSEVMQKVILTLGKIIGTVVIVAIIPLIWAIYGLGMAFAFIADLVMNLIFFLSLGTMGHLGFKFSEGWNESFGGIAIQVTQSAMAGVGELWAMQHGGIVTQPTIALLGEAGPEAVVPLHQTEEFTGQTTNNEEVIWTLEDNGEKLDRIYGAIKTQGRLR